MTDPYNGKYCKDCKNLTERVSPATVPFGLYPACKAVTEKFDHLSGAVPSFCFDERPLKCGTDGKLWEPKE